MQQDHAIVTGGAGFVGSHLVESLLDDGYRVTTLDNYGSGRAENLSHLETDALTTLDHDVRDSFSHVSDVDLIFHFASRASPEDFDSHAVEIAMTNSLGARHAYDLAVEQEATVVLASTSEVYGNPEIHPQTEEYNGNVNIRGPRAPYDESKRFSEALAEAYIRKHGLDIRTVRIFNTYGPRMRLDDGRVIPNFLTQALRGEDLTVHGDGLQTRSFCYVTDLVRGVRALADAPSSEASGEVVNIGNTNEITILQLAETVLDLCETDSEIVHEKRPEDDPDLRQPDISRAQSLLGWSPEVSLEDGLEQTIEWFQTQMK